MFALLCLALIADPAAVRRPSVLVLPIEGERAGDLDRGYALLQEAEALLLASDRFEVFESPQREAVRSEHQSELEAFATDARPRALGGMVGADYVLSGQIERAGSDWSVVLTRTSVLESEARSRTIDAPSFPELIGLEASAVAELFDFAPIAPKVARVIANEAALLAYAGCERRLVRQPLGLVTPVPLDLPLLDEAEALCASALAADPRLMGPSASLGLISALRGDRAEASRHLAKAPAGVTKSLAQAILEAPHASDQAKATLRVLVVERPRSLWAKEALADLSLALGDEGLAQVTLTAAIDAGPRQSRALIRLGELASRRGDHEAALEWTEKAARLAPDDPVITLAMALRLTEAGQAEEAALALRPWLGHPAIVDRAWYLEGRIALGQEKSGAAEAAFERVLSFPPTPARWSLRGEARYRLAALWQTERPELARQALLSAAKEGYRDREALTGPLKSLVAGGFGQRLTALARQSARPAWASLLLVDPDTGRITGRPAPSVARPRL